MWGTISVLRAADEDLLSLLVVKSVKLSFLARVVWDHSEIYHQNSNNNRNSGSWVSDFKQLVSLPEVTIKISASRYHQLLANLANISSTSRFENAI